MDARERYYWDLCGHLVLRSVLSKQEIGEVNRALDYAKQGVNEQEREGSRGSSALKGTRARWYRGDNMLNLPKPYCEPFRKMLVHPQVIYRLKTMCNTGFRLDHGPQFNNAVKGTEGLTLHGAGAPHRDMVAYKHQNGMTYCGGVTVTWNLTDCPGGNGGFACVPGSHKSDFPMPAGIRLCTDEMGAVVNPDIRAGDVLFFMDGAQTHGTHPWQNDWERRSVLFKYASRTSIRQEVTKKALMPEDYWDKEIVEGMTAEQRAVMFGPCSAPTSDGMYLDVDEHGVRVEEPERAQRAA